MKYTFATVRHCRCILYSSPYSPKGHGMGSVTRAPLKGTELVQQECLRDLPVLELLPENSLCDWQLILTSQIYHLSVKITVAAKMFLVLLNCLQSGIYQQAESRLQ